MYEVQNDYNHLFKQREILTTNINILNDFDIDNFDHDYNDIKPSSISATTISRTTMMTSTTILNQVQCRQRQ